MADDSEPVREPDKSVHNAAAPSFEATDSHTDVSAQPDAQPVTPMQKRRPWLPQRKRVAVNKTPDAVALEFLALIEQGDTPREAAGKVGIHLRTAQRLLARYDADADALQAATRAIMASEALDRVDDWRVAARVGASKRGNHLPAKDWLLHAGMIEPLQGENQAGIRVNISIGTDERPLKVVSPLLQIDEE